jgi:hypothetical protein
MKQADGSLIIMQSNGQKATVAAADIDQIVPCKISAMPEGLLNTLTLDDIANLFAYLSESPGNNIAVRTVEPAVKPAEPLGKK